MLEKILANKLVEEENTNKRLLELTQELSDAISSSRQYISTPKPLNAYIAYSGANMYYPFINTLYEFYRKGFLSELEVKLSIFYENGNRYFLVSKKYSSLLTDDYEELKFNSYGEALDQFNKWRK